MPITGKVEVQVFSYLDPFFEIEIIERSAKEIDKLIEDNNSQLQKHYKEAIADAKTSEEGSWVGDMYSDEAYILAELAKTLINGLAITINSIFERHVGLVVREMSKRSNKILYTPNSSYSIKQFRGMLKEIRHPNLAELERGLEMFSIYVDVRNILVHRDGSLEEKSHLKSYIKNNPNLFDLDVTLWRISVKPAYIELVLKDTKALFKKLLYTNGELIFDF